MNFLRCCFAVVSMLLAAPSFAGDLAQVSSTELAAAAPITFSDSLDTSFTFEVTAATEGVHAPQSWLSVNIGFADLSVGILSYQLINSSNAVVSSFSAQTTSFGSGTWYFDPGTYTLNISAAESGNHGVNVYLRSNEGALLVAPVPEPETYAMLLAGLGLISAFARRKRS